MSTTYTSDLPDSFFVALRAMNDRLAPKNPYFADWLITMMQSESGIKPHIANNAGAPYYGLIGLGVPGFAPMSADDFQALSAVDQLPYVEKFYRSANVPSMKSAGNLYQYNFVPASQSRGMSPDTVIAAKGGTGYHGNEDAFYTQNSLLDTNHDGQITVGDLDARLANIAKQPRVREAVARLPPPAGGYPPVIQANMSGASPGLIGAGIIAVGVSGFFAWRKWGR